ncbi:MAG: DUF11 domain-containing protein [Planctomycetes bacterium]|nr:DUF11 domain-containing protein [Planctomycetota bacterium]
MTRFNADGSYAWTTTFAGSGDEQAYGITVFGSTVYATGSFSSSNAGIDGAGSIATTGSIDAFVLALNATNGSSTAFGVRTLGGSLTEVGRAVAADGSAVYVAGHFRSSNAGIGGLGSQGTAGGIDAFVMAIDHTTGNAVSGFGTSGVQTFGGSGDDFAYAVGLTGSRLYVAGAFVSSDAAIDGSTGIGSSGGLDAFVLALDNVTAAPLGAFGGDGVQTFGGTSDDAAHALAIEGSTVFFAGTLRSTDATVGGSGSFSTLGGADAFVLALTNAGAADASFDTDGFQVFGGSGTEEGLAIVANAGRVYLAGFLTSSNAGVGALGSVSALGGTQDAFVAALDRSAGTAVTGFALDGVVTFGGTLDDRGQGVALEGSLVHLAGSFNSLDAGLEGSTGGFSSVGFGGFLLSLENDGDPILGRGRIGDLVFLDQNNNGLFDLPGEIGIDGVIVELYQDVGAQAGVFDLGDVLVDGAVTGGGGSYLFSNLPDGNYIVRVHPDNFLTGGALEGLGSSTGNAPTPDPDNDVDDDDNGEAMGSSGTVSRALTLIAGTEPGVGVDGDDTNGNRTVDFGFATAVDLSLSLMADDPAAPLGSPVVFTLVVTNNDATDDVGGVEVASLLPSGLTYLTHAATQGIYDEISGTWSVGILTATSSATLTLTATVSALGTLTLEGEISVSGLPDPDSTPGNASGIEDDEASATVTPPAADLALTKSVDIPAPNVGGNVTFTLTVLNQSALDADSVAVADLLPMGLSYVSDNGGIGEYDPLTGVWNVGTVTASTSRQLTITATATTPSPVVNTAEIIASSLPDPDSTPDNQVGTEDDQSSITVSPLQADLSLTKSVDNPTPIFGADVVFTLTVLNSGPGDTFGVTVQDSLPTGLTYVSDDGMGAYDSGTGVWTVGALAVAGTAELQITATVMTTNPVQNVAEVTASAALDPDSTPGNAGTADEDDDASATVTPQAADLSLTKMVDDPVPANGQTITYTLTVSNAGPSEATGVLVADLLPMGVTFVSDDAALPMDYNDMTGEWTVGSLPAGESAILNIQATVDMGVTSQVVNSAEVSASSLPDPDSSPGNTSGTEDDEAFAGIAPGGTDLELTKSVDRSIATSGDTLVYTLTVSNVGPNPATGVAVIDDLNGLPILFVSDDSASTGTSYDFATGVWSVGALGTGQSRVLEITVTIQPMVAGPLVNTAEITAADQIDPDSTISNGITTEDDYGTATVQVRQSDLSLAKVVDQAAPSVGDTVTFTITLLNSGPDDATGVQVTDLLPTGLTFSGQTPSQGTYDPMTGIWDVGTAIVATPATLALQATVTGTGTLTNTAEVTASDWADPDSTPANAPAAEDDEASAAVTVQNADLVLTKLASTLTPDFGSNVSFTINLTNNGPGNTVAVTVTDLLPAGLTFVSSNPAQGSYSSATGIWTVGSLAASSSTSLEIVATVATASPVTNIAEVTASAALDLTSTPGNAATLDEDDDDRVTLTPVAADLLLTKTVDLDPVEVGSAATFTVTVTNQGPSDATGVLVTDTLSLPANVTLGTATPSTGAFDTGTGIWTIGNLASGATVTLTLSVDVGLAAADKAVISNSAAITQVNEPDPNVTNNSDTAQTLVSVSIDLSLTKAVDDSMPYVDEDVTFTLTLSNAGPNTATGVVVSDVLPAQVSFVSATPSAGAYNNATGNWLVGDVASGATETLIIVATVVQPGEITNSTQVTAAGGTDVDSTPGNGNAADEDDDDAVTFMGIALMDSGLKLDSVKYTLNYHRGFDTDSLTIKGRLELQALRNAGIELNRLGALALQLDFGGSVLPDVPLGPSAHTAQTVTWQTGRGVVPQIKATLNRATGAFSFTASGIDLQSVLHPLHEDAPQSQVPMPVEMLLSLTLDADQGPIVFEAAQTIVASYSRPRETAAGTGQFTYGKAPCDLLEGQLFVDKAQIVQRNRAGVGAQHQAKVTLCYRPPEGFDYDLITDGMSIAIGTLVETDIGVRFDFRGGFMPNRTGTVFTYRRPTATEESAPISQLNLASVVVDKGVWKITALSHWMPGGAFGTPIATVPVAQPLAVPLGIRVRTPPVPTFATETLLIRRGLNYSK